MKLRNLLILILLLVSTIGFAYGSEGDILWQNTDLAKTIMSTTIHPNGTIYCADVDGKIFTIDPLTGEDTLRYTVAGGYIYYSNIMLSNDASVLYVPDEGNYDIIALNTNDFSVKWTYDGEYIYKTSIIDDEGFLYIVDGQNIKKLNPEDGTPEWTYLAPVYDIESAPVLKSDGSQIAYAFSDSGGYIEELNAVTGEVVFSTYHDPWDYSFGNYESPNLAYDQNDEIVYTSTTNGITTSSINRMAADGSLTTGGTDGFNSIGSGDFNAVTFTDDFRIISPRITATSSTEPIVSVFQSDLTKIFGINQNEIGATACDYRDYIDCAGTISTDNIYYTTITRGGGTGQDVYGTGILAIDIDNQQTLWFHESLTPYRTNYGATSMALMDTPVKQLICYGDTTEGLIAFEVSGSPLWTRNDFNDGTIGMWMGMTQNQFSIASEEEPVENDDRGDYGAYLAWKLSQESEELLVEEIIIEEDIPKEDDKGVISVLFEMNNANTNWWLYLLSIIGSYIGASIICKYKKTLTVKNVFYYGTFGWLVPLLITVTVFDMFILNKLLETTSMIVSFITFAIYGGICSVFSK